jgi:hypothetical protein
MQRPDNYGLVTFTSKIILHGQWDPRLRMLICRGWTGLPGCSSRLLRAEVYDAQDDSWSHCFMPSALLGF